MAHELGDRNPDVFEVFGPTLRAPERLLYPEPEYTDAVVLAAFRHLREIRHSHITLVDGAFDVPHDNHEWYLRHVRLLGARAFLHSHNYPITAETLAVAVAQPALSLVVTVDADYKVAAKKGGVEAKGGVPRPIYPWETRANRVAGYSFDSTIGLLPVIDLVTVEGDPVHQETCLESSLILAEFLARHGLLDTLVVFDEQPAVVQEARDRGLNPVLIADGVDPYVLNPQTGDNWKTSTIIRRIREGAEVPHPITSPLDRRP